MDASFARLTVAAAVTLALAGCGAATDDAVATSTEHRSIDVCPAAAPASGATTTTLRGVTGSATVVAPTKDTAPAVTVAAPFHVDRSQTETAHAGTGKQITDRSVVTVCYQGVNGRTGEVFDDAFARSTSAELALPDVVPGFRTALVGQRAGAVVVTAIPAAEGYPRGEPKAGIAPGDTLIFAISVLASNS